MGIEFTFENKIEEAKRKISASAGSLLLESVMEIRNETVKTLSGQRSGRVYYVPGTRKQYTASAPGEPPAVQTGRLRQSVRGGTEKEGDYIVGFVGTEMDYGRRLEFGTDGGKIAARPWLRPSFEKSEEKVKNILGKMWF